MQLTTILNQETEDYLKDIGYLMPDEQILKYESAGDSNMNLVVRITTDLATLIVKQSKPYVNKYPQIPAPLDRIWIEKKYYDLVHTDPILSKYSPKIFDSDAEHHTIAMQDLGQGLDFMGMYLGTILFSKTDLLQLIEYLIHLHGLTNLRFPPNQEMKALNHQHIFLYPFMEDNGFNLDTIQPGLQSLALSTCKSNEPVKTTIQRLGDRYLQTGTKLVHGDYYPGSWLKVKTGIKIIDPEFAFLGDPEFDLGVLLAHLYLAEVDASIMNEAVQLYKNKHSIQSTLMHQYAGVEILRRIIGLAQLPLKKDLDYKHSLIKKAQELINS